MINTDIEYCIIQPKPLRKCGNCMRNLGNHDSKDIQKARTYLTYIQPKVENGKCLFFKRLKND